MSTNTDPGQFIADLNGGVLSEKLSAILSQVAAGVIDHGKDGDITLKLSLKKMGDNHMVNVKHRISYTRPTTRGKLSEEDTTETPMHVGRGGRMTLFPESQVPHGQMHMLKGKAGEPMTSND